MTDYNEQNYIDACRALYRGGLTEICDTGKWRNWPAGVPSPQRAAQLQWRAVDPLREYKEAFAAGKRVEFKSLMTGKWLPIGNRDGITPDTEYRIVEPKKVKLLPFAIKLKPEKKSVWMGGYFHESLEAAIAEHGEHYHVAPINKDGSIEVEG